MEIKSTAFRDGETIPKKFTCEGPNISPPLQFSNVPNEAKSLVLMVEDPDADAKPWVHWLVLIYCRTAKALKRIRFQRARDKVCVMEIL